MASASSQHAAVACVQFSKMLDILEDYLRMRSWKYKRLDGSTNRIQRMIDIQQFNKPKCVCFEARHMHVSPCTPDCTC